MLPNFDFVVFLYLAHLVQCAVHLPTVGSASLKPIILASISAGRSAPWYDESSPTKPPQKSFVLFSV